MPNVRVETRLATRMNIIQDCKDNVICLGFNGQLLGREPMP